MIYFCSLTMHQQIKWTQDDIGSGTHFVSLLTDVLWYADGHHDTLGSQSCPIPRVFQSFVGYNVPELSKHRKRALSNMSSIQLDSYSQQLYQCLFAHYWKQDQFSTLCIAVEGLACCLKEYPAKTF